MSLELDRDGAQLYPQILSSEDFERLLEILPTALCAGERIYGNGGLAHWLTEGPVGQLASKRSGAEMKPVRAILFDKTEQTNWALAWHQDRTIAVKARADVPRFTNWNCKAGAVHVEPPFELIESMLTARIHIDPVPENNAPLLIAPGSHRLGRVEEAAIEDAVARCGRFACVAEAGDVWLYRTAILHASDRTNGARRRRVLHVDFAAEDLTGDLEWLGVG